MSTELVLIHLSHYKFHLSADIEGLGLKYWMLAKRLLSAVYGWMLIIGCGTKRWQNLVVVVNPVTIVSNSMAGGADLIF